jgi:4a-hydroxytetrahydrobiopterin dehydratase
MVLLCLDLLSNIEPRASEKNMSIADTHLPTAIDQLLVNGWSLDEQQRWLAKDFSFATFADAMVFMQRVAFDAERLDHHPDWSNSYKSVKIRLTTHVKRGLTDKDVALAIVIDNVFSQQR